MNRIRNPCLFGQRCRWQETGYRLNTGPFIKITNDNLKFEILCSKIVLSASVRIPLRDPADRSHYLALAHQDSIPGIEHISNQGIYVQLRYSCRALKTCPAKAGIYWRVLTGRAISFWSNCSTIPTPLWRRSSVHFQRSGDMCRT